MIQHLNKNLIEMITNKIFIFIYIQKISIKSLHAAGDGDGNNVDDHGDAESAGDGLLIVMMMTSFMANN